MNKSGSVIHSVIIVTVSLIVAAGAFFFMFNKNFLSEITSSDRRDPIQINLGTLPDELNVKALRLQGFSSVISLLHPEQIPFEPRFTERIKKWSEENGITFHSIPILPQLADNRLELLRLQKVVQRSSGRIYIHSNRDEERLYIALRSIAALKSSVLFEIDSSSILTGKFPIDHDFRRGEILQLTEDCYLSPPPTIEEFYEYVIGSEIDHIAFVKSSRHDSSPGNTDELERHCANYLIDTETFTVDFEEYNPWQPVDVARQIRRLPKPFMIVAAGNPPQLKESIIQAFRCDEPVLPPSMFRQKLANGRITIARPNTAWGPRPLNDEFDSYLYKNGIRKILFLGEKDSKAGAEDIGNAIASGLIWHQIPIFSGSYVDSVKSGGPWYIYGKNARTAGEDIERRFGPAIPDSVIFDTDIL